MTDDADLLNRRSAYIDRIRGLHRRERTIGFVACLIGVLVMVAGRYRPGAPFWMVWVGAGVIAAGWALFVFVIFRRTAWVRAHPFDPNG